MAAADLVAGGPQWSRVLTTNCIDSPWRYAADLADTDFWALVREAYSVSSNLVNLNNGGVSPQPKAVQEAHVRNYQYVNQAPS